MKSGQKKEKYNNIFLKMLLTLSNISYKNVQKFEKADIEDLSYKEGVKKDKQKNLHERLKYSLQYL